MRISLKNIITQSLLAIAIAVPTIIVASVSSAQAGGSSYYKHNSGGYAHRSARRSVRQSVRSSYRVRASSSYRYSTRVQRRVYVNQYRPAPNYVQSHHHHYQQAHHHHYGRAHGPYCR